jgi:hypothetical protein
MYLTVELRSYKDVEKWPVRCSLGRFLMISLEIAVALHTRDVPMVTGMWNVVDVTS